MHLLITQQSAKKPANLMPAAVAKCQQANVLSLVLPLSKYMPPAVVVQTHSPRRVAFIAPTPPSWPLSRFCSR